MQVTTLNRTYSHTIATASTINMSDTTLQSGKLGSWLLKLSHDAIEAGDSDVEEDDDEKEDEDGEDVEEEDEDEDENDNDDEVEDAEWKTTDQEAAGHVRLGSCLTFRNRWFASLRFDTFTHPYRCFIFGLVVWLSSRGFRLCEPLGPWHPQLEALRPLSSGQPRRRPITHGVCLLRLLKPLNSSRDRSGGPQHIDVNTPVQQPTCPISGHLGDRDRDQVLASADCHPALEGQHRNHVSSRLSRVFLLHDVRCVLKDARVALQAAGVEQRVHRELVLDLRPQW